MQSIITPLRTMVMLLIKWRCWLWLLLCFLFFETMNNVNQVDKICLILNFSKAFSHNIRSAHLYKVACKYGREKQQVLFTEKLKIAFECNATFTFADKRRVFGWLKRFAQFIIFSEWDFFAWVHKITPTENCFPKHF